MYDTLFVPRRLTYFLWEDISIPNCAYVPCNCNRVFASHKGLVIMTIIAPACTPAIK